MKEHTAVTITESKTGAREAVGEGREGRAGRGKIEAEKTKKFCCLMRDIKATPLLTTDQFTSVSNR
jgi:hypothetical protein